MNSWIPDVACGDVGKDEAAAATGMTAAVCAVQKAILRDSPDPCE
jgi:hypothetical protein